MGIVDPYFPASICLKLAAVASANTFIETGTYYGRTAKWAASHFEQVHTIELSELLYNQTKNELISMRIVPHCGDSRSILPKLINGGIVFWLDGHYSGGETAGEEDPCPLLNELDVILHRSHDDIIINDARLYGVEKGYPSIIEICRKIEVASKIKRCVQICDDQIYIISFKCEYVEILLDYILERSMLLWNLPRTKIVCANPIRDFMQFFLKKNKAWIKIILEKDT